MKSISEMTLTEKAVHAMESAVDKVAATHRRLNRPLAITRNGKAVLVSPDEFDALVSNEKTEGLKVEN